MADIKVTPLGAGQDVGRSCLLVSIANKNVMLDCGMHMGYNDDRRFPDFSFVTRDGTNLSEFLDAVIITHFHLDHCGALPYMSEMVGYSGPIYMTQPTKAICPLLLEDYRRITVERKGEVNFFTSQMIKDCMKKVVTVSLHQEIQVDDELTIKAYYAGHVLGAAMFEVRVGEQNVVYTGDYNMTPDRHLGSAWIDRCRPNLLITESTYATTIRDSRRCRERDFLMKVHECVEHGGKVLIPVFALGRAQELCILLETYWERMSLSKVPIYFAAGLTEKATNYYRMFISWTNQKIKHTFVKHNMFEFKHIKPFDRAYIDNPGAMVVFATPGMLHAGLSLQLFKRWAPNPLNMVIMPGYCVAGTVGHKILSGARVVELENKQQIEVKMSVQYMSFSAHADAKGIMQLIQWAEPKSVLLVHGEGEKMKFLANKIKEEFSIDCYMPANGETVAIPAPTPIYSQVSRQLIKRIFNPQKEISEGSSSSSAVDLLNTDPKRPKILHGTLVITNESVDGNSETRLRVMEPEKVLSDLSLQPHYIRFTSTVRLEDPARTPPSRIAELIRDRVSQKWKNRGPKIGIAPNGDVTISTILIKLDFNQDARDIQKDLFISWADHEDEMGCNIVKIIQGLKLPVPSSLSTVPHMGGGGGTPQAIIASGSGANK